MPGPVTVTPPGGGAEGGRSPPHSRLQIKDEVPWGGLRDCREDFCAGKAFQVRNRMCEASPQTRDLK